VTIEGDLTVRLSVNGRRVSRVAVRSTRPLAAARALAGRPPADAAAMAPRLFSICAQAQGVAAAAAAEAATDRVPAPPTRAARETTVLLETVQEYLWRILIDWPQAMDQPTLLEPVAAARHLIAPVLARLAPAARRTDGGADAAAAASPDLASALADLAGKHVFGGAPEAWLALMDAGAVAAWAERAHTIPARLFGDLLATTPELGRSDIRLMPVPRREALLTCVVPELRREPGFSQAPVWDGMPVETGALARMAAHPFVAAIRAQYGNAVPTRMAARLVELAALLGQLAAGHGDDHAAPSAHAFALDAGEGLAAVQTARGLLLHLICVAGGRVAAYQIVAPTEWNFHPDGALVHGLTGLAADDEPRLVRQARLAVQALDPCVACRVEVVHA